MHSRQRFCDRTTKLSFLNHFLIKYVPFNQQNHQFEPTDSYSIFATQPFKAVYPCMFQWLLLSMQRRGSPRVPNGTSILPNSELLSHLKQKLCQFSPYITIVVSFFMYILIASWTHRTTRESSSFHVPSRSNSHSRRYRIGKVFDADELRAIGKVAEEFNLLICADEVVRDDLFKYTP